MSADSASVQFVAKSSLSASLNAEAALSAQLGAGAAVVNDYLIQTEEIEDGHRLTITRGSEVQTFDLKNGTPGSKDAVLYTPQELSADQQAQARENVGAADIVAVNALKGDKLDKAQGAENVGKPMVVGDDGNIIPADIPEKPFAKIADVTLTEAASVISITEDMNGNPFALREIVAKISFPVTEPVMAIHLYFGIKVTPDKAFARILNTTHNLYGTESRCYAVIKHGRIMNISSATSVSVNYFQQANEHQILQGIGMLEAEKFDKLYVYTYTDGGFPAGSRVVIEGVPM